VNVVALQLEHSDACVGAHCVAEVTYAVVGQGAVVEHEAVEFLVVGEEFGQDHACLV